MSDEEWIFKMQNDSNDSIYIKNKNSSKTKILESSGDGNIDLEKQLWKKWMPDTEGYFTLENYKEPKFMTAISESCLEIRGNITLRRIPTSYISS